MKKLFALMCLVFGIVGCGNDWEVTKKNFVSDYGDLERHVVVYDSWANKVLWEYTGNIYLRDIGDSKFTLVYRDERGKVRKNDFFGGHLAIMMEEMTPELREKYNRNNEDDEDDEDDDEDDYHYSKTW